MSLADVIARMPLAVTSVTPGYTTDVTGENQTNQEGHTGYIGYTEKNPIDYDEAERQAIQWEAEQPPDPDPSGTAGVPWPDDGPARFLLSVIRNDLGLRVWLDDAGRLHIPGLTDPRDREIVARYRDALVALLKEEGHDD
ncbi:MAG: hypothetical protein OWQ56_05845 [Acidithiobacillus caldus]|nr:hypothetical protein [Acidithiobacillus caldus]